VLLIGAHPDDVEIGVGGTAVALSKAGHKVIAVDLTNGEPTPFGSPEIRARESKKAAEVLGFSERICLDLVNREVFDTVSARTKLATVIRQYQPELLFIPYWEDAHPDHIEAESLATAARFFSKFVKTDMPHSPHYPRKVFHYAAIHMRVRFEPSFIYDISPHIEQKFSALNAYESQFNSNPANSAFLKKLRTENAYWGMQIGVEYGEPFICRENIKIDSVEALLQA